MTQPFPLAPYVPRESPTPTPFNTRPASPALGDPSIPLETASFPIARLEELAQTHGKQVSTSITDGSATIPTATKLRYLVVYFLFNLGLTLFNKAVMIQVRSRAFLVGFGIRRRRRFNFGVAVYAFLAPHSTIFVLSSVNLYISALYT